MRASPTPRGSEDRGVRTGRLKRGPELRTTTLNFSKFNSKLWVARQQANQGFNSTCVSIDVAAQIHWGNSPELLAGYPERNSRLRFWTELETSVSRVSRGKPAGPHAAQVHVGDKLAHYARACTDIVFRRASPARLAATFLVEISPVETLESESLQALALVLPSPLSLSIIFEDIPRTCIQQSRVLHGKATTQDTVTS